MILILILVSLCKITLAATPSFNPDIDLITFNLSQGQTFYFDVNATDADNDSIVYSYTAYTDYTHSTPWSTFAMNNITGVINFTTGNGDVTYPNPHEVLINVIDNTSKHATAIIKFNITNINDPPNITGYVPTPLAKDIYENDSLGFTFDYNATDPDTPYGDTLSNVWIMDGVNQSSSQSWTYLPGFCEPAHRNITLLVWDSSGATDTKAWDITVINVNRLPEFNWSNPLMNLTWPEDTNLIDNITLDNYFSDPDSECENYTYNYTVNGNASVRINISNNTGHNVSLMPAHDWFGTEIINFTIYDGFNYTTSNNIVLNVTAMPDAPILQNISNQTAYAYAPFYLQIAATDPDDDTLTFYDNTTVFDIVSTSKNTSVISFTPNNTYLGNFSIMINVSDGINADFKIFNLEIINNSAPTIFDIPNQTAEENTSFSLTVNGYDLDLDTIIYRSNYTRMGLPTQLNSTSARFTFTPRQADVGVRSVRITANDTHGASISTTFILNITDINNPPQFNQTPASYIIKIGQNYTIQLNASDEDGDPITFSHNASSILFPHFNMTSSGLITITPNASDQGNFSINITIWDNTLSNLSDTIFILFNVTYNRAPFIYPLGVINTSEDSPFTLQINATDPDHDSLTFFLNNSLFNLSTSGLINFTPNQSFTGVHNLTVNVTDGDGGWYNISFILNISQSNDPPYFSPPLQDYPIWSNIREDYLTEIYVNATDEEGDDLTFTLTFLNGTQIFNIVKINANQAIINFTPNQSQVGNYSVNITVSDSEYIVAVVINFTVQNTNDAPQILTIYPYGTPLSSSTVFGWANWSQFPNATTRINASENSTLFLNHTSYDEDNDSLTYKWYLDGAIVSLLPYWNYTLDYNSSGIHNITFAINDSHNTTTMYWNLSVNNTNRAPLFGKKLHSLTSDFSGGSAQNINITSSGLLLTHNETGYSPAGLFTSQIIDIGIAQNFEYTAIGWEATIPGNFSITLQTSTSSNSGSGWSDWSNAVNMSLYNSSQINSTTYRYIKYRLNFTSADTASTAQVSSIAVNYVISNESQVENYYTIENSSGSYWIDLDDFFQDPDQDSLNFSYTGSGDASIVDVWIEGWNSNHVGIRSHSEGTYIVTFTARDPSGQNISSNPVTLVFTHDSNAEGGTTTTTSSSSSSSTIVVRTRTQEVEKPVNKYVNLDIIVPEALTTYANSTIVSPIKLVNTGDKPLQNINLSAESNGTGFKFEFTKNFFKSLGVGEEVRTNLLITSPEFLGNYEVLVKADVQDPVFSDSAKIIISTLERGELNKTQIMTKITFTRDLLLANPECLELNELLKQAELELNKSNYAKANEIIEETIRYCRYMIVSKETLKENPSAFQRFYNRIFGLTSKRQVIIFASIIIFVFVVLTISLLVERIKTSREIKRKKKKSET